MSRSESSRPAPFAAAAVALVALLVLVALPPSARGQTSGLGFGILAVEGSAAEDFALSLGGTYYLAVGTDDESSYVNASVTYNGSLLAQENHTLSGSTFVSLPAGNYSMSLTGRGRAALAWDFTNGTPTAFPDGQTLVAFLLPAAGPWIHVDVAMGDAQAIALRVYDAGLVAAGNATVSSSGTVDFVLPSSRAAFAVLVATVTAGNPSGLYELSWSSGPLSPPLDVTAWPFFLLWILVPIAAAAVVFVLLQRRRGRSGRGP